MTSDKLDVHQFHSIENDDLDVMNIRPKNHSTVSGKVTYQNKSALLKKRKSKLYRGAAKLFIVAGIAVFGYYTYQGMNYVNYPHETEQMSEGQPVRSPEALNLKTFVQDFLIANPSATDQDIQTAIDGGALDYYYNNNGLVEINDGRYHFNFKDGLHKHPDLNNGELTNDQVIEKSKEIMPQLEVEGKGRTR